MATNKENTIISLQPAANSARAYDGAEKSPL